MTRLRQSIAILLCCTTLSGCYVHEYSVGTGGLGISTETERQVYFLFGLFRMNEVDPEAMAQDSTSFTVRSEFALSDIILSIAGFPFGFSTRSVTVER